MPAMWLSLATDEAPEPTVVGGKAASLIRLRQAGFSVPEGVVISTGFFAPWQAGVLGSRQWLEAEALLGRTLSGHHGAELAQACDRVKSLAGELPWTAGQRAQLEAVQAQMGAGLLAVRSSSPEEDLAGASFAGLYETFLDVEPAGLPEAVRACFCACLDQRVLLYKARMNIERFEPAIAVVVQKRLAADVSGVAFSINPGTNDFDELLINASWGSGDAVVGGAVTPDAALLNRVTGEVIDYRLGSKGGDRSAQRCLKHEELDLLAEAMQSIEALFDCPVDVEWAFAEGRLQLLQARPITTYVPLHPSLLTAPGEPRRLYMDGYLTDGITMSSATTPMTDDVFNLMYRLLWQWLLNVPATQRDHSSMGVHTQTGRLYIDLSMYMHLLDRVKGFAKAADAMNPIVARVLTSPAMDRYRLDQVPRQVRLMRLLGHLPAILWRCRWAIAALLAPLLRPRRFDADYERAIAEFTEWIERPIDYSHSVSDSLQEAIACAAQTILKSSYPAYLLFYFLSFRIKTLAGFKSAERRAWANAILGSQGDDLVLRMGLAIYDLAKRLPAAEFEDIEGLAAKLRRRDLPEEFLAGWEDFARRFGCRGPLEMELANPKFGEAPELALRQMAVLSLGSEAFNPHDMVRRRAAQREQAYRDLEAALPPRKARRLRKHYAKISRYGASRELFKHHVMQVYARVRPLLLHRAQAFVQAGRLDRPEQIFELWIEDVDRAAADPAFDLRACVEARGAFARKLAAHVRAFPMFIDSRGRILLRGTSPSRPLADPPADDQPRILTGAAISPGVARGPAKVLAAPLEKPVLPGDVLVAVTTDPGWTPLFINAAAVVLEIGGELQHGALVAREYGKPCVSAIVDVTAQIKDGQQVEVDGDAGVVRLLGPA